MTIVFEFDCDHLSKERIRDQFPGANIFFMYENNINLYDFMVADCIVFKTRVKFQDPKNIWEDPVIVPYNTLPEALMIIKSQCSRYLQEYVD